MPDPTVAATHAVIVGIERYKAGVSWDLDGPVSDAIRFLKYLHRQGVPKANVTAYLAPKPENKALVARAQAFASSVDQPVQSVIDDLIEEKLRLLNAPYYYFSGLAMA